MTLRNYRVGKIMETYWRNAGELTKEVAPLLSAEEKFFFNEYKNINVEYQQSFPFEFDLKKVGFRFFGFLLSEICAEKFLGPRTAQAHIYRGASFGGMRGNCRV